MGRKNGVKWASSHFWAETMIEEKKLKSNKINYKASKYNKLIYKKFINLYNNEYELCVNII